MQLSRRDPDEITEPSIWAKMPPKARKVIWGFSGAGCFGVVLWGLNQFLSLRGVIHVLASRIVLAATVAVAILGLFFFTRLLAKRRSLSFCIGAAVVMLLGVLLDWWAPKPKPNSLANKNPVPNLSISCIKTGAPLIQPGTSDNVLVLNYPYEENKLANYGIGDFEQPSNFSRTAKQWPPLEKDWRIGGAYHCELDNHGTNSAIQAIYMPFEIQYILNNYSPQNTEEHERLVHVPIVDAGGKFSFYIVSLSKKAIILTLPKKYQYGNPPAFADLERVALSIDNLGQSYGMLFVGAKGEWDMTKIRAFN